MNQRTGTRIVRPAKLRKCCLNAGELHVIDRRYDIQLSKRRKAQRAMRDTVRWAPFGQLRVDRDPLIFDGNRNNQLVYELTGPMTWPSKSPIRMVSDVRHRAHGRQDDQIREGTQQVAMPRISRGRRAFRRNRRTAGGGWILVSHGG